MASPGKPTTISNPGFKATRTKSKKKHFVQQKVEVFRASTPALSVFMWGIIHTVNDLCHVPVPIMLLPDDFKANRKIKVSNHLFNKENLPRNFKFKEYCPQVFRNLRERFGVDDLDYQASLTRNCPTKDGDSEEEKVSFTSYDCTLSVNQLCSEDVEDVHNILSDYHQHIATCHGITLLPQLLGMYRVTVDNEDTYLIVLRNMFSHRRLIHRKYDLKVKDLYAFKDADLRTNTLRIYISDEDKEKFMTKLSRDVEFLVRLKITDYSLLLGVHDVEVEEEEGADSPCEDEEDTEDGVGVACPPAASLAPACEGGAGGGKPTSAGALRPCTEAHAIQSTEGTPHREVYFMGLIDILMHSDTKRKAVHAAKTVRHGPGAETSTANAEQYGQRFLECITNIIS